VTVRIQLVLIDLPAQGIAVNAKNFRRAGLVAVRAVQNALDERFSNSPTASSNSIPRSTI